MIDRHHLLFERSTWASNPQSKRLRSTTSLIPRIDRELHDEIHRQMATVPMLGRQAMFRVVNYFEPTGNTLADIDGLALSIERATKPGHSPEGERLLGELAIDSLMRQRELLSSHLTVVR